MSDVKTAVRTLKIFELFASRQQPLVLSELAEQLEIPVSSCSLLIRTLLERGYLYEVARRAGYYPTRRVFDYATSIVAHDPVMQRVRPVLEALRDETAETVTLAKLQGHRLIYLLVLDSPQVIRPAIAAGTLRPVHSTATGKALLSTLDDESRQALLEQAGLAKLTPKTIVSRSKLEAQLKQSSADGWYQNEGESVPELNGVAVPLKFNNDAYAISVMGPSYRMAGRHQTIAQMLIGAREAIGSGL
jgi:DNA-binding IclR family transcriptional regulator